ncbi:hypothetical protein T492DRAFT_837987 [Pavlovales sp. CCMP2436]|nr:hypothetical protein T492DRAFT_837987 [Pavlovales sp. CCMP2436]
MYNHFTNTCKRWYTVQPAYGQQRDDDAHQFELMPADGGRTFVTCGADRSIKRWATPTLAMMVFSNKKTLRDVVVAVVIFGSESEMRMRMMAVGQANAGHDGTVGW